MPESKSRVCFVIMPFSGTKSCAEREWTQIFDELFKPAIEGAELGYECRRSNATRGNIVAGIVRDLNDAYVVLADLTDRNANVSNRRRLSAWTIDGEGIQALRIAPSEMA